MINFPYSSNMSISCSSFAPSNGTKEYFITVNPEDGLSLSEQLSSASKLYKSRLAELRLDLTTCVYINIYISDAINDEGIIRGSSFFKNLHENKIAVSILQLPPMFSKVAIIAYHVVSESMLRKEAISLDNGHGTVVLISNNIYTCYFLKGFTAADSLSAEDQTKNLLNKISSFCKSREIPYTNIVRTWIYLRDINRDYLDMAESRREVFSNWGLSEKDKFPASTGIGGRDKNPQNLILMDAIIIGGIKEKQIQRMETMTHMSHAISYGVTFERGLKIRYGDRDHLYISGTASIDINGNVMHRADILKQTERTLENIRALLEESSSSFQNLVYLVIYLKDPANAEIVNRYLNASLPEHIPFILLQADICRQEWLIEIEGMAISKSHNPLYNDF